MLIHGGFHGKWCWDRVLELLDHPGVAIDLPGRGTVSSPKQPDCRLADYAAAIVSGVEAADFDEVLLVGHSLAGLALPLAVQRLRERVVHVVYLSALVAPDGGSALDLVPAPLRQILQHRMSRSARWPAATLDVPRWLAKHYLCNGLDRDDSELVLSRICAEPLGPIADPSATPNLEPTPPRTYVGFSDDRVVTQSMQRRFARSAGARWLATEAGHDGMIGNPAAVAQIINWIAAE